MRHFVLLSAAALLAACGSKTETAGNTVAAGTATGANAAAPTFDNGFRVSYRTKFVESCTSGAKQAAVQAGAQAGAAARVDFTKVCGCAADKLLATKSIAELMRGPSQADQAAVTQACLQENPITAG